MGQIAPEASKIQNQREGAGVGIAAEGVLTAKGTLRQAVGGGEEGGDEPVDADGGFAASHEDLKPADHSCRLKAQAGGHSREPAPINRVVGLGEVGIQQPCWDAELSEAGRHAEVVLYIVRDVSSAEKSRLSDVDDVI